MQETYSANGVQGVLHWPEERRGDAIVLTHGAGSNAHAPLLLRLAESFTAAGYLVLRFDLPYRVLRPKGPPHPSTAARDREGVERAVDAVRKLVPGRVIAGGHSYGGRQSTVAASERPRMADALLLLSYPLHPPGRPAQLRTAHFPQLRTPALFVHGATDPFASFEELRDAISLIPAPTDILPVEGVGHDLRRAGDLAAEMLTRLQALL